MENDTLLASYIAQLHGPYLDTALLALKHAVKSGDAQQVIMAIPMLLALTICPAMLGTQEAIRQSQSKTKREERRAQRCNLVTSCVRPSIRAGDINGKIVVLKEGKLYIASQTALDPLQPDSDDQDYNTTTGHPFAGYFLPYPDSKYEGVVSTINDLPQPQLNWIYVDRDTYEVKHGLRVDAQQHISGPFDCTRQDRRMTLEGWEGFVAVEETPGVWALYFDRDDNGLKGKVPFGTRVLEVELTRREKKEHKPRRTDEEARTLDEKMKQHKENERRKEEERQRFAAAANTNAEEPVALQEAERVVSPAVQADEGEDWSHLKVDGYEDNASAGSKTAVPSVWGDETQPEGLMDGERVDDGYRKPYVEDVAHAG